jgi:hypothetical protein
MNSENKSVCLQDADNSVNGILYLLNNLRINIPALIGKPFNGNALFHSDSSPQSLPRQGRKKRSIPCYCGILQIHL